VICPTCVRAGVYNTHGDYEIAADKHLACEYVDCPCQHKTGDNWYIKKT
jgi:hypothetical protein